MRKAKDISSAIVASIVVIVSGAESVNSGSDGAAVAMLLSTVSAAGCAGVAAVGDCVTDCVADCVGAAVDGCVAWACVVAGTATALADALLAVDAPCAAVAFFTCEAATPFTLVEVFGASVEVVGGSVETASASQQVVANGFAIVTAVASLPSFRAYPEGQFSVASSKLWQVASQHPTI